MNRFLKSLSFVGVCFCLLAITNGSEPTSTPTPPALTQKEILWQGLNKAWPCEKKPIDLYCENESLTQICFQSGGQTFLYSSETGNAELVVHAKKIPPHINRISYEKTVTAFFVLWYYGNRELEIGAR